ncbi:MAG: polysaccharide deacetylase family protein [bacterium]
MVKRLFFLPAVCCFLAAVSAEDKFVGLTFDDGPHPYYTEQILKILKKHSATATFFLVGGQIKKYPDLARLVISEGCETGNHTYSHPRLIFLSDKEVSQEIKKTSALLEETDCADVKYFRPPGGRYYFSTLQNIGGLETVLWTINTDDIGKTAEEIWQEARAACDGDILLMHSGVEQTIAVLPRILRHFSNKGIRAVSISELRFQESRKAFSRACSQELY